MEIAAIVYDTDTNEEIDSFHEYIKPNKRIPAAVVELTGITDAKVANCRTEVQVLMDFAEWFTLCGAAKVVGHNCKAFDLSFLAARCEKYKIHFATNEMEIVDTLTLARQLNKEGKIDTENCKQPTLAEFFGIEYEAHSAIEDVRALIKIYAKMMRFYQKPTRASLGF